MERGINRGPATQRYLSFNESVEIARNSFTRLIKIVLKIIHEKIRDSLLLGVLNVRGIVRDYIVASCGHAYAYLRVDGIRSTV